MSPSTCSWLSNSLLADDELHVVFDQPPPVCDRGRTHLDNGELCLFSVLLKHDFVSSRPATRSVLPHMSEKPQLSSTIKHDRRSVPDMPNMYNTIIGFHFGHQSSLDKSSGRNSITSLHGIAFRVYLMFVNNRHNHNLSIIIYVLDST